NSLFEQVFEYNGFSRADTTASPGASASAGAPSLAALTDAVTLDEVSRADRTVAGPGGRAIGWLLPVAAAGAVLGVWTSRRRPRGDPLRAATLLWTAWLLVDVASFTATDTINAYYLAALTPPVAALTGIAVATWSTFRGTVARGRGDRDWPVPGRCVHRTPWRPRSRRCRPGRPGRGHHRDHCRAGRPVRHTI